MDIEDVIRRIGLGDKQAFAEIVMHYQQPIFSFLGRMSLSQGVAEEVAQETFIRAWRHIDDYQTTKAAFSTWLFTIARNLALNELTSARSKNEFEAAEEMVDLAADLPEPMQILCIKQQLVHLQAALRQLNTHDRSVIGLTYVDELSMADIARIEGDSLEAIKTRLHRAKQKLRNLMEKTYAN